MEEVVRWPQKSLAGLNYLNDYSNQYRNFFKPKVCKISDNGALVVDSLDFRFQLVKIYTRYNKQAFGIATIAF